MSILNFFGLGYPKIKYEPRGENITYKLEDRELFVATTYHDGERIYTDSIEKWDNGRLLTHEEKSKAISDLVDFVRRTKSKNPIIVINVDKDKQLWEREIERLKIKIKSIEYTSEKEKDDVEYNMYLGFLPMLTIGGYEIKTKEDLDNYWITRKKR
ncbi:hypothetical protein [Chryseolinea sp. H1M3-3]|uniref:hypothetical protein n=1 Tax=Chryseolinea sp. H1M3-3 TaxID=3034144 RepID=UPI0023EDE3DA|nr:hypothetical protein [Chryseolinea sp. H1M3-3]